MVCLECKNNIPEKSNFCPHCGSQIEKNNHSEIKTPLTKNPGLLLLVAGIAAILIVITILDSNKQNISNTINDGTDNDFAEENMQIESLINQLSTDAKNNTLYIEIGNRLFDIQKYEESIKYYKQSLKLNPDNTDVRIDLGVAYFNSQNPDAALIEIEKALKINPNHKQGLFNLGIIYLNLGNKELAKSSLNKLIEHHENTEMAKTAKQLLKNL